MYPKIQIEPASLIKPCLSSKSAKDSFTVDRPTSKWRNLIHVIRNEGLLWILKTISTIDVSATKNKYYAYGLKAAQILALAMLKMHQMYKTIYGYFYPYSMLSDDDVCDIFSRCFEWSSGIIRAFAWHPNYDRCAVAISNDCVHIYESSNRTRLLRHHHQRKIVDMCWHPNDKELLVVATQTNLIMWLVPETHSNKPFSTTASYNQLIVPRSQAIKAKANNNEDLATNRTNFNHVDGFKSNQINNTNSIMGLAQTTNPKVVHRIIYDFIKPPITCIKFDIDGNKLFVCSPNSTSIKVINIKELLGISSNTNEHISQLTNWDLHGVTRISWSPNKTRLVSATTSHFIRVYESIQWSSNKWSAFNNYVQDFVWSRPSGKFLLIAPSDEPCLYVLPFLDTAMANDVGGTKSIMKALDLSEQLGEDGNMVGGRVKSLVWDKNGKRLAISFKDNPDSVLLFKTSERPTVEFQQIGVVQNYTGSTPLLMEFHDKFKDGSLLTICWSDGNCQHVPMIYSVTDQNPSDQSNNSGNQSSNQAQKSVSSPRSLTNFCQSSSLNASSLPSHVRLNKTQHHTTLFSTSIRSPLTEKNNGNES